MFQDQKRLCIQCHGGRFTHSVISANVRCRFDGSGATRTFGQPAQWSRQRWHRQTPLATPVRTRRTMPLLDGPVDLGSTQQWRRVTLSRLRRREPLVPGRMGCSDRARVQPSLSAEDPLSHVQSRPRADTRRFSVIPKTLPVNGHHSMVTISRSWLRRAVKGTSDRSRCNESCAASSQVSS